MFKGEGHYKAIRFCFTCFTGAQTWSLEEIPALNGLDQLTLLGNSALVTVDENKGVSFFKKRKPEPSANRQEFEQILGDGKEQGSLGHKKSDTT